MVVWVDSFSDCFVGGGVEAVVEVLRTAGYAPQLLDRAACCGLTWISTGQREGARKQLRTSLEVLHPYVVVGSPRGRSGAVVYGRLAERRPGAAAG